MHPSFQKQFSELETDLQALLSQLAIYSNDQLNAKLSPAHWSVLQVMQHLMVSECLSVQSIQRQMEKGRTFEKAGIQSWARGQLLGISLRSPFKFKAPGIVNETAFLSEGDFETLAGAWKNQRREMDVWLHQFPASLHRHLVFKHPYAGLLTLHGMLRFNLLHFRRHRKQIWNILERQI